MKRITLVIALAISLINFNASGQEKGTVYGIKAGINYSNFILGKDIPSEFPADFNGKIGFHFGGFLKLRLTDDLKLKPELLFSMQGAEYELNLDSFIIGPYVDPSFSNVFKADIKENLILLPIMLDYCLNENFDIEFGPQLGLVISHDISHNNAILYYETGDYDKFEIGLNVGIGYNFTENYRIGARYNYGILERNNRKSAVFQIGLEYKMK